HPPHHSTLLPYTTLFRSELARLVDRGLVEASIFDAAAVVLVGERAAAHAPRWLAAADDRPLLALISGTVPPALAALPPLPPLPPDRKSTRLTSSHLGISY